MAAATEVRRATDALGEMLSCRIEHMEQSLESTLERTLEAAVRTLGGSGAVGHSASGFASRPSGSAWTARADSLGPGQELRQRAGSPGPLSGTIQLPPAPSPAIGNTFLVAPLPSSSLQQEFVSQAQSYDGCHFGALDPEVGHNADTSLSTLARGTCRVPAAVQFEEQERRPSSESSGDLARRIGLLDRQNAQHTLNEGVITPRMWPAWFSHPVVESASIDSERDSMAVEPAEVIKGEIRVGFAEIEARGFDANGNLQDRDVHVTHERHNTVTDSTYPRLQKLVMHPASNPILVWHTIGPILLAYDIVMIPMKAFPLPELRVFRVIALISTTFWTIDAVRGFFTGYETDKAVEMRLYMIGKRYLRSWFVLDALACTADWIFLLDGNVGMFNKFWRTGRSLQAWKMLRLVRLVRVLKFAKRISSFTADQVTSVQGLIALKSLYIGFAVTVFCHYVACYWYLVGDLHLQLEKFSDVAHPQSETEASWLFEYHLANSTLLAVYVSSFHWAVGQSGFAPTHVYPTTTVERLYASGVSFCWLIIVSVTINCFSIWLGHLHEANKDRESQNIHLRKFLDEHDVSRKLTYRVLHSFRSNYQTHRRRVHQEDVEFLRDLPISLKIRLRKECFMPLLKTHPFFRFICCISQTIPIVICYCAMQEARYLAGDSVFVEGILATHMYYVLIGRLDYYSRQRNLGVTKLESGDWACDPALWLRWTCRGRLVAEITSEIVSVDVEKFQAIMQYAKARGENTSFAELFAKNICQYFCDDCPNTDLWRDTKVMEERASHILALMGSSRRFSQSASVRSESWQS